MNAKKIAQYLENLRQKPPLVHNITNYVVMNSTANGLLAIGARPAMVHAREEVEEFLQISSALVINIGTLSPHWVEAMFMAANCASKIGKPWVLDPVGAGATKYRSRISHRLLQQKPSILRANASEISSLGGQFADAPKGVDATVSSDSVLSVAKELSRKLAMTIVMTGEVDYIVEGDTVVAIANGHPMMTNVTGLGCLASAFCAAFLGTGISPLESGVAALACLGIAGEIAGRHAQGPASLQIELINTLYMINGDMIAENLKIS